MKMKETTTEQTSTDVYKVELNSIEPGEYYARIQYMVHYITSNGSYSFIIWETNKRKASNGQRYRIKQLVNGETFKSIFYFNDFESYLDVVGKVFKIKVIHENKFPRVDIATTCTEKETIELDKYLPIKDDWTYAELVKYKEGGRIIFPNGIIDSLDTYLKEVEEYELEQKSKNKKKLI